MNTIHSSSLASYQTGYVRLARDSINRTQPAKDTGVTIGKTENPADNQASAPETVRSALIQAGLNRQVDVFENASPRNYKALQAYTQTNEQLNKAQLDNLITHVDYYA